MRGGIALGIVGVVAIVVVAAVVGGCGGGGKTGVTGAKLPPKGPPEVSDHAGQWPAPNGDLLNSRVATSSISSSNVKKLGVAWSAPITAAGVFGGYATTPIIAGDTVYTQELDSTVTAYSLSGGAQKWRREFPNEPNLGPNGVTLGYGKIFGATANFAFALDADTGDLVWRSQKLTRNKNEGIDMAPSVYDGLVYVSTVPGNAKGFYKGDGVGRLFGLDADNGNERWVFNTVPEDLWDARYKNVNSGGGLWYSPAFDRNGDLYADVANPAPWPGTNKLPWGKSRPGPDLYTDSIVKLDHKNGALKWYRQVLPHDVYDWDLQLSPVIAKTGGRDVVVAAGKVGYVYEADAKSGELLWRTRVGVHNGHDTDNLKALTGSDVALPKLPVTVLPGVLGGVETQLAATDKAVYAAVVNLPTTFVDQQTPKIDFTKGSGDLVALDLASGKVLWDTKLSAAPYGAATVANDLVFTTTFDGKVHAFDRSNGREVWTYQLPTATNATVAIAGDTLLTAASVPHGSVKAEIVAFRLGAHGSVTPTPPTTTTSPTTTSAPQGGANQALGKQVFSQNCATCHTLAAAKATGTVGPNLDQLHPDAARVKRQVENGGATMPAFKGRLSDEQIEAVSQFVAKEANPNAKPSNQGGGTP
jgi:glucose dehydrogenase/mono/diheme cytochrome c family protein